MSAFPWTNSENESQQSAREQYAAALKAQVNERSAKVQQKKQLERDADRLDDERVERESAVFRAQAQAEIQAQRDRESLVARREAFAKQQYAQSQQQSREDKVEAYQRTLETSVQEPIALSAGQRAPPGGATSIMLGGDSSVGQASAAPLRRSAAQMSAAREEAEAGLARAAANGNMRPDQEADSQAAAIRRRQQGSSIF